jgi:hypothetical protein
MFLSIQAALQQLGIPAEEKKDGAGEKKDDDKKPGSK